MIVIFSATAKRDMVKLARYVAEESPARSRALLAELYDRAQEIGLFPLAHQTVADPNPKGLRRRVVGNYLVLYRVRSEHVEIARVVHGSRNVARLIDGSR